MPTRLSDLERRAFTQVNGNPTMMVEEVGGTQTEAPNVRLSELQRGSFSVVDGNIAVRVMNVGGGGGPSGCTLETNVNTTSFGWDNSGSPSLNFNEDNNGFEWDLELGDTSIVALCDNELVTPLPTTTGGFGSLSVVTIFLGGIDITNDVIVDSTTTNKIKIKYNTKIINPNLTDDNTFIVSLVLLIGTTAVPTLTQTLTYNRPIHELSAVTDSIKFSESYTTATALRSFPNGDPETIVSTFVGATEQVTGAVDLIFAGVNIYSPDEDRILIEVVEFLNATDLSMSTVTNTFIIIPDFQFPIYLGSVDTTVGLDKEVVNTFDQVGTFMSRPDNIVFDWPDKPGSIKIFGIASTFYDGMINFKANSSSVIGNIQSTLTKFPIPTGPGNETNFDYNYYEALGGQPGPVSLFVEFLDV